MLKPYACTSNSPIPGDKQLQLAFEGDLDWLCEGLRIAVLVTAIIYGLKVVPRGGVTVIIQALAMIVISEQRASRYQQGYQHP